MGLLPGLRGMRLHIRTRHTDNAGGKGCSVSANLIGFGADLQQKLDAMDGRSCRARWAGYVASELFGIAERLHPLSVKARSGRATSADDRAEKQLLEQGRIAVQELGFGISVYTQPDPWGWPIVVVFPGDVPKGSGPESVFEQGVAVPPRP